MLPVSRLLLPSWHALPGDTIQAVAEQGCPSFVICFGKQLSHQVQSSASSEIHAAWMHLSPRLVDFTLSNLFPEASHWTAFGRTVLIIDALMPDHVLQVLQCFT